ncbi:MAG: hypothetical protein RMK32_03135 [Anaerolineae bacterium]|nr:hypothetical protein [Anaerolineae bacterium]
MESVFGIGLMELAFIFLLAFILLGPRDLPRLAYRLGRWIRQAQLLYAEFRREWEAELQETSWEVERAIQDPPKVILPPEAATYQLPPSSRTTDANPSTIDRSEER